MQYELLPTAIHDARQLGHTKMILLGVQHMFAMFGSTILVPILTGLPISTALFMAGVGTLIFHLLTKLKVPAFLGSSFAFIGGYLYIKEMGSELGMPDAMALDYACVGIFCAGMVYLMVAMIVKMFGVEKVLRFFPPIVTGPIVIAIGLVLSGSAIEKCQDNWWIAMTALATVVIANIWGRGFIKIIPIILGVIGSYVMAVCLGEVDFSSLNDVPWIGFPISYENTVFSIFESPDYALMASSIFAIMPIAVATIMEHIGDMSAISSTVGKNLLKDPGLHRTLAGDGIATAVASLFGAPANTTYGENVGVLNLSRVFDTRVIRLAAYMAVILSFCPKFAQFIYIMPHATVGGVSLILYGMISSVGVRNLVETKADLSLSRNFIVVASILVLSVGIKYGLNDQVDIFGIKLSGLAVASIVGVFLNAIFPSEEKLKRGG
ncbi:MAG: uracil-xanthine permease family protein [Bacteroidaceae bacterium]|nr:uracil-xanthine permease family protein [Bacteroidaceae bacterium]